MPTYLLPPKFAPPTMTGLNMASGTSSHGDGEGLRSSEDSVQAQPRGLSPQGWWLAMMPHVSDQHPARFRRFRSG